MRRLILPVLLGLSAYYGIFGGEYSLIDTWRIRGETASGIGVLSRLQFETDSMAQRADVLESDPQTLETLARERFGMIRDGEVLYRFADDGEVDTRQDPE